MTKLNALFALPLLAASMSVQAALPPVTLTFQQGVNGYTGTQDTMIRSNETGTGAGQSSAGDSRGRNFGAATFVSVDGDDGEPGLKPNQGLLRFDGVFGTSAGQINPLDTILSAKVTLTIFDAGSGFTVHDMLINWNQMTVTWNSVGNGIQADGVEAVAASLASFGANNSSANVVTGKLHFDVTNSLKAVQTGTLPGYGWVMIPFVNGTNGIDWRSSEFATIADRPLLTVQVQPIPEPETYALLLAGLGLVGLVARHRRRDICR